MFLPSERREYGTRLHGQERHNVLMEKVHEMKKTVDGFALKYTKQYCTEFLRGNEQLLCRTLSIGLVLFKCRNQPVYSIVPFQRTRSGFRMVANEAKDVPRCLMACSC